MCDEVNKASEIKYSMDTAVMLNKRTAVNSPVVALGIRFFPLFALEFHVFRHLRLNSAVNLSDLNANGLQCLLCFGFHLIDLLCSLE